MKNMILVFCYLVVPVVSSSLIVHEWGTHTSMQGSNGIGMRGLEHEEESLPQFVHSRGQQAGLLESPKGIEWSTDISPELEVTQKLETPVLYFYSPTAVDVQVDVKFPQGIITQVYPNMTEFSPSIGQVSRVGAGYGQWRVHVHEPERMVEVPPVSDDNIWAPSRNVAANMLSYQGENEHLIFYRGVGQWQTDVRVTSTANTLTVTNFGKSDSLPAVFVLESTGTSGAIRSLGSLGSQQGLSSPLVGTSLGDRLLPMKLHVTRCQVLLEQALLEAGLYPLEARAMVETWSHSYFQSAGLRVLYVLPRSWTDSILPINIHPAPSQLERVLVGRVEVLTHAQEQTLAHNLQDVTNSQQLQQALEQIDLASLGRFAEAKLSRAAEVAGTSQLKDVIRSHFKTLQ